MKNFFRYTLPRLLLVAVVLLSIIWVNDQIQARQIEAMLAESSQKILAGDDSNLDLVADTNDLISSSAHPHSILDTPGLAFFRTR